MASRSRNILLRLTGDSSDAKRAVNDVRADLRRMSREEATIRLDVATARAERSLDSINARIARYRASGPVTKEVDLKIRKAEEAAALISLRLDRLRLKKVNIDVDVRRGTFERVAAGAASVERGLAGVERGVGGFFRSIPIFGGMLASLIDGALALGRALGSMVEAGVSGFARLVPSLAGIAGPIGSIVGSIASAGIGLVGFGALLGGVLIAINAVAGAVVALGGALVALVASLAAAAGGFAALGVAFGAAFLPALIVGIGLFQRFFAILKTRQAREQALTQAIQEQKTAEQTRAAALQASKRAEEQLAEATVEGRRAMTQAAITERNAELALQDSQLGLKGARLGVIEAKRQLRDLLQTANVAGPALNSLVKKVSNVDFDPSNLGRVVGAVRGAGGQTKDPIAIARAILNVQTAQQGVKDAINQTTNAERALAEATRQRVEFAKRGLDAYKPYRTALAAVVAAENRLRRAQDQTSAAQRKYERALRGLSTTERGTLSRLDAFIAKFKDLAKAVSDPIFQALNSTFDLLTRSGGNFRAVLVEVGRAFATVITAFGRWLTQPATLNAFTVLAHGAASLVRQLGAHAFISFLTIMREIAISALPAVQAAARGVSRWLGRIAAQPRAIHRVVGRLIDQFRTWARFAGAVSRLVLALFRQAAPAGRSLADSMTRIVNRWTRWINSHPDAVRRFFNDAVAKTRRIVHWLVQIGSWLRTHLPAAAAKAKDAFNGIYHVIKKIIDGVRWIQNASTDISNAMGLGAAPGDVANIARNDLRIIKTDLALLKTHLSPQRRSVVRDEVIEALRELLDRRGSVGRQFEIPSNQRERLTNILNSLLGARSKRPVPRAKAGSASAGGVNLHVTVPGGGAPDPRTLAAKLDRELRLAG